MEAYCLRPEQFLRFVTLLTNDATFLLDEALHKMEEIHELERVRADAAQWGALTQEQQQVRRMASFAHHSAIPPCEHYSHTTPALRNRCAYRRASPRRL